jgi:DNA polymerase-3 subunit epsilon
VDEYTLCRKFVGLYDNHGPCFHYGIRQCNGACAGKESDEDYNQRVAGAIGGVTYEHESFVVLDEGRTNDERAVVIVENGRYLGYGYVSATESFENIEQLKSCITHSPDNRDVQTIIKGYLERHSVEKVIAYDVAAANVQI